MAVTSATPATSFRMTGGRRAALFFGVPVCLALVAGTGFSLVGDFGEGHYPVTYTAPASTTALTLNVTGQVTIRPTTASQATLTGTASYSLVRPAVTEHITAQTRSPASRVSTRSRLCSAKRAHAARKNSA